MNVNDVIYLRDVQKLTWPQISHVLQEGEEACRSAYRRADHAKLVLSPEQQREADIAELLAHAQKSQEIMGRLDPVITHLDIDLPDNKPWAMLLSGCFQTGGRWTFHEFIRTRLDKLFSHPRYMTGTFGDEIENFKSGGFAGARSSEEQALTIPMQRKLWNLWMDKYHDKIAWAIGSQHGTMWDERGGYSPIKDMYQHYKVPFFDGMGYIKLHLGEQTYQIAVAHEFPGNSMWNVLHPQKRALWQRYPNADIIAQADKHQYAVMDTDVYSNEVNAGNRASTQLLLIQIGTAKGGPDPYTIRGWERGTMEWPIVVFYPDRHMMKVTRDVNDALMWLGKP